MKSFFSILIFTILIVESSCNKIVKKEKEPGTETVIQKSQDTIVVAVDTLTMTKEWNEFKKISEEKIKRNETELERFREKMKKSGEKVTKKYREIMAELERKNENLKQKLVEYKYESKQKWEEYTREFNHDMNEITEAIKDLFKENI